MQVNFKSGTVDPNHKKKHFSFRHLSVQLNLIVLAVSTIVLSIFGIYHASKQAASLEKKLVQSLQIEALQLAASLSVPLYNFDDESLRTVCEAALKSPEVLKITIWDLDHKYLELYDISQPGSAEKPRTKTIEYPIVWGSEYLGKLEVVATMERLDESVLQIKKDIILQVVVLDIILGLVLIIVLRKRLILPLQQLERSSEQIARGNLDFPISAAGRDELGTLAGNLVIMREAVKEKVVSLQAEVDQHHQTSVALKKSEAFLHQIINMIPHLIFVKNAEGRFIVVNRAVADQLDMRPEDVAGRLHRDIGSDPKITEQMLRDDRIVIESGKALNTVTERYDSLKRKSVWHSTQKIPFQAPDGDMVVVGITADISDLKYAETQLRQTNIFIDSILNSIPSVLFSLDRECRITKWNRKAEKYYGISVKEAVSRLLVDVLPVFKPLMPQIKKQMGSFQPYFFPKKMRSTAVGNVYEQISVSSLIAEHVEGVVIRVDDVTAQVRMEELVVQSEKMMSVGGLAAGMAHEINNPLAGMMQNAQVVLNRLIGDLPASSEAARKAGISMDQIREFMENRGILWQLELINEAGVQAAKVVQNMLSFSKKGDAGKYRQNIAELLDKTVEVAQSDYNLKTRYDFKKIRIIRDYQEDLPDVICEPSKIQQVFFNILKNAAEAMHQAENLENPMFFLGISYQSGSVVIEIKDNGPGMEEKTRKRVFEPFFTTKPVDEGTGLGLSVSYFIIRENHAGQIEVISEPGKGATFIIRLPAN